MEMEANGMSSHKINAIFEVMHQRVAIAEQTLVKERENANRQRDDYTVLMGNFRIWRLK